MPERHRKNFFGKQKTFVLDEKPNNAVKNHLVTNDQLGFIYYEKQQPVPANTDPCITCQFTYFNPGSCNDGNEYIWQ